MSEWKWYTLEQLGEIVGGGTPSTKNASFYGGEIAWITPKDLSTHNERFIARGERNITSAGLKSCAAKVMPAKSVLFTSRAPIGYIAIAQQEVCTNQGFKSIVPNENVDPLFLYYLLVYNRAKIEGMGSGTTFKEVSGSVMRKVPVYIPEDIAEQKRIAAVLSSLDDKIENNKRINRHLEQMAQAVFKSWFIDFAPFGGKTPKDWRSARLGDAFIFQRGGGITKNDVVSIRDRENPYVVYGAGREVFGYSKGFALKNPSVLVAAIGAGAGTVSRSYEAKYSVTSNVFYVTVRNPYEYPYAVYALKRFDFVGRCSGSAQPMLAYGAFATDEILIPSEPVLRKFNELCMPLMRMVDLNLQNATSLAHLRDMLLPHLMSGEMPVVDDDR